MVDGLFKLGKLLFLIDQQYYTILYCSVLYCSIPHCTVLWPICFYCLLFLLFMCSFCKFARAHIKIQINSIQYCIVLYYTSKFTKSEKTLTIEARLHFSFIKYYFFLNSQVKNKLLYCFKLVCFSCKQIIIAAVKYLVKSDHHDPLDTLQ